MNSKIKDLLDQINSMDSKQARLEEKIQREFNKVFEDSKELARVISNAENASEYSFDENGDIVSWYRFGDLADYVDCREYFEAWIQEVHNISVDWDNDCLMISQGECITIQDDTLYSRDNGVYLNGKCIINEAEYRDDGEDVDEFKRNALIEAHMEHSGYYPGVFRVTQYGDVFPVNTHKKVKK